MSCTLLTVLNVPIPMAFTKRKARRKMDTYIQSYIGQDRLFKVQINDHTVLVIEMTPITTRQFALRASLQEKVIGEKTTIQKYIKTRRLWKRDTFTTSA